MIELKKIYQKTSKQTQNRLQEIFNSFQIDFNSLYNIADSKTKKRVNTYVEEWQDKGLLKGYFGSLAKNIYGRTRVKNSEILELLIYSAYIEEQNKLDEQELNIFKEDVNYYYQQGQEEVNKTLPKKQQKHSVIPDAIFLALLTMPNSKGYIRQDYNEALAKYNADQVYRQATIDLQQQKELDITNDIYQNIIKKQNNSKININGDKISGDIDLTLIGINNQAKVEGIKSIDNDAKVVFLAEIDNKTTPMCHSLNRQEFYIDKENEFDRYYGEIPNELSIQRIKCKGLVLGLNLPPISHHFHWCRSTIQYIPSIVEKEEKTEYNLDIPKISAGVKPLLDGIKLNKKINKLFKKYLIDDNIKYDESRNIPAWYNEEDNLIHISQDKNKWDNYEPVEVLTHEITHLIDKRNNVLDNNKNISSLIRSSELEININIEKYKTMFENEELYYDMSAGDVISILSNGKIETFYYHPKGYIYANEDIIANIETAYLTDNKIALDFFSNNETLNKLKNKIVEAYNEYTK